MASSSHCTRPGPRSRCMAGMPSGPSGTYGSDCMALESLCIASRPCCMALRSYCMAGTPGGSSGIHGACGESPARKLPLPAPSQPRPPALASTPSAAAAAARSLPRPKRPPPGDPPSRDAEKLSHGDAPAGVPPDSPRGNSSGVGVGDAPAARPPGPSEWQPAGIRSAAARLAPPPLPLLIPRAAPSPSPSSAPPVPPVRDGSSGSSRGSAAVEGGTVSRRLRAAENSTCICSASGMPADACNTKPKRSCSHTRLKVWRLGGSPCWTCRGRGYRCTSAEQSGTGRSWITRGKASDTSPPPTHTSSPTHAHTCTWITRGKASEGKANKAGQGKRGQGKARCRTGK
eukprot:361820-Chlamydomonas_euryale.AAC.3